MITIIHGDDIAKSRKFFIDQKILYKNSVLLHGQTITLTDIVQIFEGNDLFTTEKYIFIEDLFSKKKGNKEIDEIIKVINQNQKDANIYVWESKSLTPGQLKKFSTPEIKQFKIPQTIFIFLEALKPNNSKTLLQLFHQALFNEDIQFLFIMLIRQFRLLIAVYDQPANPIEEIKRMATWQKGKLQKQTTLFTIEQLKIAYQKLYTIEHGLKTGTLSLSLEQAIDFFLVEL